MNYLRNIVFPLILAVGMLALGLCIRSGFSSLSTKNRFGESQGGFFMPAGPPRCRKVPSALDGGGRTII